MQRNCTQIKKWEIAEFIFIAIVGTLLHFVYDWSGQNPAVGIIAPVSESMAWIVVGFYTYTGVWGKDVAWIDILLFYTAVALYTWLSKRSIEKEKKYCNAGVGTAVFVLTFILFLVFTVQPPKIGLFQDPQMGSVNVSKMLV